MDLQYPVAVIDMGSNTFHLLIGKKTEDGSSFLYKEKVGVKLAYGGISQGILNPESMKRGLNCLAHFDEKCRQYKVPKQNIIAVATSAVRSAQNRASFLEAVSQKTRIVPTVIAGEIEADFIFKGVSHAVLIGENPVLLMDIGGGSVEFLIANNEGIIWKRSLEIGGQRLMDQFMKGEKIEGEQIFHLGQFLTEQLKEVLEMARMHGVNLLLGSSGTFDSLVEIHEKSLGHENFSMDHQKSAELSIEAFHAIAHKLIHSNRAERLAIPGMVELRVDMIVVATIMIQVVLSALPIEKILISNYSLKHGVFFSIMKGETLVF
jgi:exopolyphosphatase/guanosine-5'-triphosphate,3'-diphosphate pyrophosphatase